MNKDFNLEEFKHFLSSQEGVPPSLSHSVLQSARRELQPSLTRVAGRLGAMHFFAAGFTLLFCPQFGVGPLGGGHGMMGWFMDYGPTVCALLCGAFFMGTTAVVGQFLLTAPERRLVLGKGLWLFPVLAGFSMAMLMLVGRGSESISLGFSGFWFLAAVLTGLGLFRVLEISRRLALPPKPNAR